MPVAAAVRPLSRLQSAVLEALAYSDLFDYPLTPEEVRRFLPCEAELAEVESALQSGELAGLVAREGPYVLLRGRRAIAARRQRRNAASTALMRTAVRYGRTIARLPFVRMVAVTGSLAAANAEPGDDIDYLIVTAPGRVWLTRALTIIVVRCAALRGVTLCPNYLLAETALALPDHDRYTARELLQMRPVAGHSVHARMLQANPWWRDFLPNARPSPIDAACASRPSHLRRAVEWLLSRRPFDFVEAWLLAHKGGELRLRAGPEAVFDEIMCKGHFGAWRERTQRRLEQRLRELLQQTDE